MSEIKWTAAQNAAITDRGGTILVSAAAGSGKTAVLAQRAVRLMTDPFNPVAADRLLIVTFTRAAAEEMRARIAKGLAERSAADPKNALLRRQSLLLGRANICTIDAFCMQLLKRYFAELDLPPDFTIADDARALALQQSALAAVLEKAYQDDPDFCAFASLFGRARSDDSAAGAVLDLYDFSHSLPHPARVLREAAAAYQTDEPLVETKWGRLLLQNASAAAEHALRGLDKALDIAAAEPELAKYLPALESDRAFFAELMYLIEMRRWDEAAARARQYKPPRLASVPGTSVGKDAVKALRDDAKETRERMAKDIFLCTQAQFDEDRRRIAPMAAALARAAELFSQTFFEAKLNEGVLEYSDLEHLALRLLCDENGEKTAVARTVSHNFDVVMVDEYQDTNELQALLYQCLANDDASNLFFVGDVKQSIYRFRLASPEVFTKKRGGFSPYTPDGPHPAVITLGENFRSAQSVIDQINDVFSLVMSREVGGVMYDERERLVCGGTDYDGGAMELEIVDLDDVDKLLGEAVAAADAVERLVKGDFPVRGKNGTIHTCGWGDICILLRGRKKFSLYEAELTRRGIPVFADTSESPLESTEVSPLLSLLRVVDNPRQDVHLAAVMLSVMYSFTPDDLVAMRLAQPKGSLYAALLHSEDKKAKDFCETLRALRRLSVTSSVAALCEEIFVRTQYFAAVGAMENGAARRETLRAFTAWADAVDSGAGGLAAFLRVVDSTLESKKKSGDNAPAPPSNAVSIMTIHRSKGLEFPVVILADASHRFNLRDTSGAVLTHPALGLGMSLRAEEGGLYSTVPHKAISAALRAESVSEEMRILYVALTRARDKLIVTAPLENARKKLSKLAQSLAGTGGADAYVLGQAKSFAEWLCTAALLHPDCETLRQEAGVPGLPVLSARGRMTAGIRAPQVVGGAAEPDTFVRAAAPDEELVERLLQNFRTRYANAQLCALPARLSVSELTHGDLPPVLARPAFIYREGMTAAERGTAMHAALQFAELDRAREDLPAELERLTAGGWLDRDAARGIDRNRLSKFLQSPLAQRMCDARTLLREYAFITAVPARRIDPTLPPSADAWIRVQGIADVVILNGETAEIADYKTDRGKSAEQLVRMYQAQLLLYRAAVEKRLGVRVMRCTIYSFALNSEIDVPLAPSAPDARP